MVYVTQQLRHLWFKGSSLSSMPLEIENAVCKDPAWPCIEQTHQQPNRFRSSGHRETVKYPPVWLHRSVVRAESRGYFAPEHGGKVRTVKKSRGRQYLVDVADIIILVSVRGCFLGRYLSQGLNILLLRILPLQLLLSIAFAFANLAWWLVCSRYNYITYARNSPDIESQQSNQGS